MRAITDEPFDKLRVTQSGVMVSLSNHDNPLGYFRINSHEQGFTKGHENQRDKKVPPILVEMDRRGFLVPPEEIFG
ncbi:MAG: hypothetical protein HZA08_02195 [Nitrospirae bacterium]|nr:hypothetical protein [Nitrospirota bacterium]